DAWLNIGLCGNVVLLPRHDAPAPPRERCGSIGTGKPYEPIRRPAVCSVRKTDARHQPLEARIQTDGIEPGSKQYARIEPLLVASLQPGHRLIRVPERCVDRGDFRSVRRPRVRP